MKVCEPERILRYQILHMFVCDEWVDNTKPGGTAGVYTLVPAVKLIAGDRSFFILFLLSPEAEISASFMGKI